MSASGAPTPHFVMDLQLASLARPGLARPMRACQSQPSHYKNAIAYAVSTQRDSAARPAQPCQNENRDTLLAIGRMLPF